MLKEIINKRNIKKYTALVNKINQTYKDIIEHKKSHNFSISEKLQEIKNNATIKHKEKTILAMAYAKLAAKETLNMTYYDVQLIGALALVDGAMAEMKTGEGKTLTCSAAVCANYVLGFTTHVATANEYLAKRDEETLHSLYSHMGISSSFNIPSMSKEEKRQSYKTDVVYSTAQEFGFDFLKDNLIYNPEEKLQPLSFSKVKSIIDEADFILIDEARTPLIISGNAPLQEQDFYYKIKDLANSLKQAPIDHNDKLEDIEIKQTLGDFWLDEKQKTVYLTEKGYHKFEDNLHNINSIEHSTSLYDANNSWLINELLNSLKAQYLYVKDKDYVVQDNKIVIIDRNTGRLSNGRTWTEGLHQAIEAKENLDINPENMTIGSISIQNYFRNYCQISGMSGTIMQSTEEFEEIYHCKTLQIPTNKAIVRIEHEDHIYVNAENKYKSILNDIQDRHHKLQPILIGTTSVAESEIISSMLQQQNLPHYVLNAKNHALEAQIIAQAGEPGRITVATSMAGRGTDIILGGNKETIAELLHKQLLTIENRISFASEAMKNIVITEDIELVINKPSDIDINIYVNQQHIDKLYDEHHLLSELTDNTAKIWNHLYSLKLSIEEQLKQLESSYDQKRKTVFDAGGLCVIGSSRNESRRIDNQLKGRSGRQGDPGECVFYMSLEDSWVSVFGKNPMLAHFIKTLPPEMPISTPSITKVFAKAQNNIESYHFELRKNTYQYDTVTDEGRRKFIDLRNDILFNKQKAKDILYQQLYIDLSTLINKDFLSYAQEHQDNFNVEHISSYSLKELYHFIEQYKNSSEYQYYKEENLDLRYESFLNQVLMRLFDDQKEELWNELNASLLSTLDNYWTHHLSFINEAQKNVGFSGLAQKNPVYEYKKLCFQSFSHMLKNLKEKVVKEFIDMSKIETTI